MGPIHDGRNGKDAIEYVCLICGIIREQDETMKNPITITEDAAQKIGQLMAKAPQGTPGVRLNVKPTGCSGNSYEMEYIKPGDDLAKDDVFEAHDVKLYIPKIHSWMLFGIEVDYETDELGSSRFSFKNPNESGRCGCGESFHVDIEGLQKLQDESSVNKSS